MQTDHEVTLHSHLYMRACICKAVLVVLFFYYSLHIFSFLLHFKQHDVFDLTMGCILRKEKRLIIHKRVSFHSIISILLLLLLCSCMMTIRQDIFNICITCVVYEVRRKGIIYSKTYFFSLFTHCLGIKKSQSNKSRKNVFFFAKVSNSF